MSPHRCLLKSPSASHNKSLSDICFFSLYLQENVLFLFCYHMFYFFPFLDSVSTLLSGQNLYQSKVQWQQSGWGVICPLYSPARESFWQLRNFISYLTIRLLCVAFSVILITNKHWTLGPQDLNWIFSCSKSQFLWLNSRVRCSCSISQQ